MTPRFGCVVLTGGGRPAALERAVASLQAQEGVEVDVAVVFNGTPATGLPTVARVVSLPDPVGIPAGRNAGAAAVGGELLFFLDDDATLRDRDTLARVAALLDAEPSIGCVQLRVDVDGPGPPGRPWVPRLRVGDCGRGRWRSAAHCSSRSVAGRATSASSTRAWRWPGR
jgi:GT2 family glycosyltransferase